MIEAGRSWWWHRRSKGYGLRRDASVLVHECEAFLAGRLAAEWIGEHWRVPAWAWMNVLAHGSPARLAALRDDGGPATRRWAPAVAYLAGVALAAADASAAGLEGIQHDVLVPLELDMHTSRVAGPDELVTLVVGALQQYRS